MREKPKTPRQELEASLTALLLGELSTEKAKALRELMAKDVELARLYSRLEQAIGLVKETAAPEEAVVGEPALKMSGEKREQLLAHFKTVAPKEFEKPTRREIRVRELAMAVGIVAFVGIAAWLTFSLTQESFTLTSRIKQVDVAESSREVTDMVGRDSTEVQKARPQSTVATIVARPTAQRATETSLEVARGRVVTSGASGGGGNIGSPSQTSFDGPSSGRPVANNIVLPIATDFADTASPRGLYADSSNASTFERGDPQWVGILERGNSSPLAHSSTNQFVTTYASIAVPTNQMDVSGTVNLAYSPRAPVGASTNGIISQDAVNFLDAIRSQGFGKSGATVADNGQNAQGTGQTEDLLRRRAASISQDDTVLMSPVTPVEQMPARALREPVAAGVPVQTTAPSTPVASEKLAELAQRSKDASGSNIYLGAELAKADTQFGAWALDNDADRGRVGGTKKEEESLKRMGEVADGTTRAGRESRGLGFSLLGPKETPEQTVSLAYDSNARTQPDMTKSLGQDTEKVQSLGDVPMLGKALKGGEVKPGLTDSLSANTSLSVPQTNLETFGGLIAGVPAGNIPEHVDGAGHWQFTTGSANRGWVGNTETNTPLAPA